MMIVIFALERTPLARKQKEIPTKKTQISTRELRKGHFLIDILSMLFGSVLFC